MAEQIRVRFTSKHDDCNPPDTAFNVPTRANRLGLSEIVNHLLQNSPPIPFDFLIEGQLLRTSLSKYLKKTGKSAEDILELECIPALKPPESESSIEAPDWISSLSCSEEYIVSGCYDGSFRVASADTGATVVDASASRKPIKCVGLGSRADGPLIVTGGKDCVVRVWEASRASKSSVIISQTLNCRGHTDSVESIALNPTSTRIATGDWKGTIYLWKLDETDEGTAKRRRTGSHAKASGVEEQTPDNNLAGFHTQCVSGLAWNDGSIVSGSWDHKVSVIDVRSGGVESSHIRGNKVVTSLSLSERTPTLVATGHPDHIVRIWDFRAGSDALVKQAFGGHKAWVSGVSWAPGSDTVLASVSHDGTARLWDVRADAALHKLDAHKGKALAVDWAGVGKLVTGGDDNCARLFKVPSLASREEFSATAVSEPMAVSGGGGGGGGSGVGAGL